MLTVEDQKILRKSGDKARSETLRFDIERGVSAERLSTNLDWIRFKSGIEKEIDLYNKEKGANYDAILGDAATADEKAKAVDKIRSLSQQIENFKFIIGLPESQMKSGQKAAEQLKLLEEGENG